MSLAGISAVDVERSERECHSAQKEQASLWFKMLFT
jgi:hypothetical protein